jgi:hypothetical protein
MLKICKIKTKFHIFFLFKIIYFYVFASRASSKFRAAFILTNQRREKVRVFYIYNLNFSVQILFGFPRLNVASTTRVLRDPGSRLN